MQQGTSQLTFSWSYVNSQKINLESYDNPRPVETWHEKVIIRLKLKAKRFPNIWVKKTKPHTLLPVLSNTNPMLIFCVSNGNDSFSFSSHTTKFRSGLWSVGFFKMSSFKRAVRHFMFIYSFKNFVLCTPS